MNNNQSKEIKISLDELNKIRIAKDALGPNRDDRSVEIINDKTTKKTSSIMMGYNKENIKLENGEYVNLDEIESALRNATFINGRNTKIKHKKTNKTIKTDKFIKEILSKLNQKAQIILNGKSDKITNQNTAKITIKGEGSKEIHNKGVLMLGNDDLHLENGEYVSVDELNKALNDYFMVNIEKNISTNNTINNNDKHNDFNEKKDVKKIKNKQKARIATISTILITLLIAGATFQMPIQGEQLNPKISATVITKEVGEVSNNELTTGKSKIYLDDGDIVYSNSKKTGIYGEIGESSTIRNPGYYILEYIAITDAGNKIIETEFREDQTLDNIVEKACKENNLTREEINIMLHVGNPTTGWIDYDDLQLSKEIVKNEISIFESEFYGKVTIPTEEGNVTLNLKDKQGNLIKEGTIVIGSNGKGYLVSSLDMKIKTGTNQEERSIKIHPMNELLKSALAINALKQEKEEYRQQIKEYKENKDLAYKISNFENFYENNEIENYQARESYEKKGISR